MKYTHKQLLEDLARHKESIYINCHLGSPFLEYYEGQNRRIKQVSCGDYPWTEEQRILVPIADLIKIRPSYNRFCIDIFEVKASRADFQSDIRSEKWKKYLPFCHRFYFAVASGILKKDEIPPEAGLYVRGEKSWVCTKQSVKRDIELDLRMLQAMLFYRQKPGKKERFMTYMTGKSKTAEKKLKEIGFSYNEYFKYVKEKGR